MAAVKAVKNKAFIAALILGVAAASPAFAGMFKKNRAPEADAGIQTLSIAFQERIRTYDVYVPPSYDGQTALPLVLNFHGGAGNAGAAREQTGFNKKADLEKFIVVYPQGTGKKVLGTIHGTWNVGRMGGGQAYENGVDDVGFVRAMVADLQARYRIDPARIYATGHSMGGMISYKLACEAGDLIAAVAPVATALTVESCDPAEPVSVMHFHGTADRPVPYSGGVSDPDLPKMFVIGGPYPSAQESVDFWARANRCLTDKTISYQRGDVTCLTRSECAASSEVTLCTVQNGGHTWPGGAVVNNKKWWLKLVGKTTSDISATDAIWDFFKRHPKRG